MYLVIYRAFEPLRNTLLDEPLSNLDAKLRVQTRAEITKLHQELQTTFIYVTHDQVEAMTMASRIAVMNIGMLQQVDSPQQLYDNPANMFVAGFIGSPAMNFFDASVAKANGALRMDVGDFSVEVPKDKQAAYATYEGKDVVFGLRPEDIHDPNFKPPGINESLVEAKVEVTELMGNEVFIYAQSGNNKYVARVDPRTSARVGETQQVVFNMNNMHLFDKETELSLT